MCACGQDEFYTTGYACPPVPTAKRAEPWDVHFSESSGASPVGGDPGKDALLVGVNLLLIAC